MHSAALTSSPAPPRTAAAGSREYNLAASKTGQESGNREYDLVATDLPNETQSVVYYDLEDECQLTNDTHVYENAATLQR